jgi:hypothetical protein
MTRSRSLLIALALAATPLAAALPAAAQVGPPPRVPPGASLAQVTVTLGPQLALMRSRYGEREIGDLIEVLQRRIALAAPKAGFVRADLVLEDARPNRPTFEQQARITGLSSRSLSLGGAWVTGVLTRADGSTQPLVFSDFETSLDQDRGASTWYDAERAFDRLAGRIARGDVPQRRGPGTPGPYSCRGAFDVWCTG